MELIYMPILVIAIAIILNFIFKLFLKRIINLKIGKLDINKRRQKTLMGLFQNVFKFLLFLASIIVILNIFGINTNTIMASLGVMSVVIGLAFQDILKDFIAGIFILIEGNYTIGDNVEIGGFKGEIIEIGLKTTKIKSISGQVKIMSNRNVTEVINYSISSSRLILDIKFKYEKSTFEIEKELEQLVKKMKTDYNKELIIEGIQDIDSENITYRLKVEAKPNGNFELKREILKEMKENFNHNKVKIEYSVIEVLNEKL